MHPERMRPIGTNGKIDMQTMRCKCFGCVWEICIEGCADKRFMGVEAERLLCGEEAWKALAVYRQSTKSSINT